MKLESVELTPLTLAIEARPDIARSWGDCPPAPVSVSLAPQPASSTAAANAAITKCFFIRLHLQDLVGRVIIMEGADVSSITFLRSAKYEIAEIANMYVIPPRAPVRAGQFDVGAQQKRPRSHAALSCGITDQGIKESRDQWPQVGAAYQLTESM
ncbi:hypothetical protein [Massilia rhizosphaerae]|uniref:hypothetical protein n=1 Tax=Massilia rhizosphaerae TaxID=2784389 RepID=UPI0018DB5B0B|nr:hypothetical protein [Massilia rhizosphaerae]